MVSETPFIWTVYDFIVTGNLGWQMTIFSGGMLVFLWSKIILNKQTETEGKKVQIPSKTILWTIFYFGIFLIIILIINFFFNDSNSSAIEQIVKE